MEITIVKHKITIYGSLLDGFIVRIYDLKGYMHVVYNTLRTRNKKEKTLWINPHQDWKGNYKF